MSLTSGAKLSDLDSVRGLIFVLQELRLGDWGLDPHVRIRYAYLV